MMLEHFGADGSFPLIDFIFSFCSTFYFNFNANIFYILIVGKMSVEAGNKQPNRCHFVLRSDQVI